MALLYIDNFEDKPTGNPRSLQPSIFSIETFAEASNSSLSIVSGTLSQKALRIRNSGTSTNWGRCYFNVNIGQSTAIFTVGLSVRIDGVNKGKSPFMSMTTDGSGDIFSEANGAITIAGSTSREGLLVSNVYSYIEISVNKITGEFDLFVNNVLELSGSFPIGSNYSISIGRGMSAYSRDYQYFDDIYILDDTGTTHNSRLGPVRAVRVPFNTTSEANFTPFGAADNISAINKDTLNTSSFNRSPAANDVGDYFKLDTSVLPTDRPIIAVQQTPFYRKTDIGERSLKVVAKDGVSRKEMPLPDRLATFSGGGSQILETAVDGTAWDLTKLANTDFGYEVTA